jgi:hypothetical protein
MTAIAMPVPARPWPWAALAAFVGLLLGVGVVAAAGLIAGTGRMAGESPQSKALKVLRPDRADVALTVRRLAVAERVSDLQAAGQQAQRTVERLRGRDGALALIDDAAVRGTAERAHRADIAILSGIAGLTEVDRKHLDAWDAGERQVVAALGDLDAVAAPVAAMDDVQPLRLDSRSVEAAATASSAYLTTAAEKLARYEKRMVGFRAKNRKRLQVGADYRSTVRGLMASYGATRKDLQVYLTDVKTFDEQIPAFRSTLQEARSKRQSIRGTLASMNPPSGLSGEHGALVAVLDKAIAGTEAGTDLADATQLMRDSGDDSSSAFELPEYQRFSDISDEITGELSSATGNWNTAMATYIRRLKHPKGAPHTPVI